MPRALVCRYSYSIMTDKIKFYGIETNNLKNIDITLSKNKINLIVGPSGSGKTSLAYDTIAQIGQHELLSMYADDVNAPAYKVKHYENIVTTIPIRQVNNNCNTRSTVGTFSGLNRCIILLYSYIYNVPESEFSLRKQENVCSLCHGIGSVRVPDIHKLISPDIPIKDNPFRCWKRHQEFYKKILTMVCRDHTIDDNKTFFQLNREEQEFLLNGISENKYQIRFKKQSSFSTRTTKYYGILTNMPMIKNFKLAESFYSEATCPQCHGKRFARELDKYKIQDTSIGEFFLLDFRKILTFLNRLSTGNVSKDILFEINKIKKYVKRAIDFNLGHLCFSRTIPSLSGGELQRLRMIQVFNSSLSDLLIVLDEPLTGLSKTEQQIVLENIKMLVPQNTLLIVDHSDSFRHIADNIIALGPVGGKNGGYLINCTEYLKNDTLYCDFAPQKIKCSIPIKIQSSVYEYNGVNLSIVKNGLNLICGRSGIGKSTLLREYFPQQFERYLYINQRGLIGNKNSTVATVLNIFDSITKLFADKYNMDKNEFSNQTGKGGVCPNCYGAGYLEYAITQSNFCKVQCQECAGTGFHSKLKKYQINGKNIFDIWNMTIDEAIPFFKDCDKKISNMLNLASLLMLGHLKIGQPICTLSGGENVRIKILKASHSTAEIIGFDEPFKGLNNSEISKVLDFLNTLRKKEKTIVVIDHTTDVQAYFEKRIELTVNSNGILIEKKE